MDDILLYHTKTLQQIYLSYRTLPVVLGFPVFTLYLIPAHLQFLTDLFLNRIPSFSSHLISSSSPSPNLHIPNLVCPFQSLPILLSPPHPIPRLLLSCYQPGGLFPRKWWWNYPGLDCKSFCRRLVTTGSRCLMLSGVSLAGPWTEGSSHPADLIAGTEWWGTRFSGKVIE